MTTPEERARRVLEGPRELMPEDVLARLQDIACGKASQSAPAARGEVDMAHPTRFAPERLCGLPGAFPARHLETAFRATPATEKLLGCFGRRPDGWLAILGEPGVGKTQLAVEIARRSGLDARYWTWDALMAEERRAFSNAPKGPNVWGPPLPMELAGHCGLLLLDDYHQPRSDWEWQQADALFDARYMLRRPLVLLSNLSEAGLRAAMGERNCSRLHDLGGVVRVSGPDRRATGSSGVRL